MAKYKQAADIRVGVVGYGGAFNMGQVHLKEMRAAGMTPTAVTDTDASRLKVAEADFPGIQTFTSLTDMLRSDVDLIVLITPHNTHAKLALQCLRAGKHVVCEKPFAVTTAECDAMIAEAKKRKLLLSTYHNRHWDGCILEAMDKIVKKKMIGDVVRIEAHMGGYNQPSDWWRSSKSISGGVLYDWGVHLLEYTLQLMNADIVEVAGFAKTGVWASKTKWKKDTNEDEGFVVVRYGNGAWSTLTITTIDCHPKPGMLEITGTKGSYIFEMGTWEIITPAAKGGRTIRRGPNRPGKWGNFYQNIADHLTKGTKLVITPEWARRPIHILDLAGRSAKGGVALKAKYR